MTMKLFNFSALRAPTARAPVMMQQSLKVFNADGSLKKDYGVVGYWHRNPFKRWAFALGQFINKWRKNK
jgi:hypothetical protein